MTGAGDSFFGHVSDVAPAAVSRAQGWHDVDIRFLLPPDVQPGATPLALFRALFPPGAAHAAHTHPRAAEFVYVVRGTAVLGAGDGQERTGGPGTVQLVPPGSVHWLRNPGPHEWVEVLGGYLGAVSLADAGYVPHADGAGR